jgi:hypothetical protein
MRELVRTGQYIASTHATDEMEADGLTIFDVEHCVLTGKIIMRQRDQVTREWKYIIEGDSILDERMQVVAKIAPTGKLVFITVYLV